jgi:hypothetical protein
MLDGDATGLPKEASDASFQQDIVAAGAGAL